MIRWGVKLLDTVWKEWQRKIANCDRREMLSGCQDKPQNEVVTEGRQKLKHVLDFYFAA
jgi:hypothetical protein